MFVHLCCVASACASSALGAQRGTEETQSLWLDGLCDINLLNSLKHHSWSFEREPFPREIKVYSFAIVLGVVHGHD